MSRIDSILKVKCPNGVEYRSIGSMITRVRTKGKTSDDVTQVYVVSNTMGIVRSEDYHDNEVHSKDTSNYTIIKQGMFAYNPSRLNIGSLGLLKMQETGLVSPMYVVFSIDENVILQDYMLLNLKSSFVKNRIDSLKEEGARFRFDYTRWDKIEIPVPPIEVQQEIVRILDKFTELEAELQAELDARKKQYDEYLNMLMDFANDDSIKYMPVGELFEIKNGLNKEKEAFGKGKPIINFTDVFKKRYLINGNFSGLVDVNEEEIERYCAKKGDVFFTRTSETREDIGMSSTLIEDIEGCVFSGFVLRARPMTNLLLPKFSSYYFSTKHVRRTIMRYASFTTRATTTGPKLSKIMVPILPISEQQKIVDILDRMDTICNDYEKGLPAEIEARHKQYEYYRDKLLTFERKVV